MPLPDPPAEFAAKVRAEIAIAEKASLWFLHKVGFKVGAKPRACAACGVAIDLETRGCNSCYHRHYYRNHMRPNTKPKIGMCIGCGCPWDEDNPKCRTCSSRHSMRRYNAYKKALKYM